MMIRSLVNDIVRRRLWPIPVAAIVVAGAAPVLFLHSSQPAVAPTQITAPAVHEPASLQKLLSQDTATPKAPINRSWSVHDPFQAPAAFSAPAPTAGAGTAKTAATAATAPVPVIVVTPKTTKTATPAPAPVTTTPALPSAPAVTNPVVALAHSAVAAVDLRFGAHANTHLRRAVSRLHPFVAHGKLIAQFVRYSPARNRAVFAVAPGVKLAGSVHCRRVDTICRYVDLKAGSHVRITIPLPDGSVVTRRLDVVHIRHHITPRVAHVAMRTTAEGRCMLSVLLVQVPGGPLLGRTACATADARKVVVAKLPTLKHALDQVLATIALSASVATR